MIRKGKVKQTRTSPGAAELLRELFLNKGELCPAEAYRALKDGGRKTSYPAILRLFYDLRQLSLIEYTRSESGKTVIDKRFHRIIPGKEDDPRWQINPHHLLYPDSAIGGLNYKEGMSHGRDKQYTQGNKIPDTGSG